MYVEKTQEGYNIMGINTRLLVLLVNALEDILAEESYLTRSCENKQLLELLFRALSKELD